LKAPSLRPPENTRAGHPEYRGLVLGLGLGVLVGVTLGVGVRDDVALTDATSLGAVLVLGTELGLGVAEAAGGVHTVVASQAPRPRVVPLQSMALGASAAPVRTASLFAAKVKVQATSVVPSPVVTEPLTSSALGSDSDRLRVTSHPGLSPAW